MILDKNSIFGVTASILYNVINIAQESRKDCKKIPTIYDIYEYAVSLQLGRQVGLTTAMCSWINDLYLISQENPPDVLYIITSHHMASVIHSKLGCNGLPQTLIISPNDISRVRGRKFDYVICDPASTMSMKDVDTIIQTVYKPNTTLIKIG